MNPSDHNMNLGSNTYIHGGTSREEKREMKVKRNLLLPVAACAADPQGGDGSSAPEQGEGPPDRTWRRKADDR